MMTCVACVSATALRQKNVCVPKMGLSFLALYSKVHFSPEAKFFGFGGVDGFARSFPTPRPHPMDKHIPVLVSDYIIQSERRSLLSSQAKAWCQKDPSPGPGGGAK